MRKVIAPQWKSEQMAKILQGQSIDVTTKYTTAIQWLIVRLTKYSVPFKLNNLGAGVKHVTTNTDVCPCCKRRLP